MRNCIDLAGGMLAAGLLARVTIRFDVINCESERKRLKMT